MTAARPRLLVVSATTGYQFRSFRTAADRLGVDLVFATDRCHQLDDPWRDGAVPIRFHDEEVAVRAIVASAAAVPLDGVVAVGDRPATIAALAAEALGLPGHPVCAVRDATHKLRSRVRLRDAGLAVPEFRALPVAADEAALLDGARFPCVVKPMALAASRGVMRADTPRQLAAAAARLRRLLETPSVRAQRDSANEAILIETFVPGREVALEGVLTDGALRTFAIFDKPDPLDGPFFEETIYVTPDTLPPGPRGDLIAEVERAVHALGLAHGPVHAEARIDGDRIVVLEVAPRPIGGRCARVLRFDPAAGRDGAGDWTSLEEVLVRHALGESVDGWRVNRGSSAVMMIPVPGAGICRGVTGLDAARAVPGVDEVAITVKPGERLVPWPEGSSYPGFIFARGKDRAAVMEAVRTAHRHLRFDIATELPVGPDGRR
ncbi:MAG: ATP-grasp domain-containing protein [Acidobacteria bacterium]|nr:ATP-grasp domain-containing protein [Acidobacteriota bacterium]MYD70823.1 ATP-grasp domain-containing protein [Acidobacteriota bacterium]MYJ05007.1 ATP-grasp domain-containing protein [Acidobacteriota bacterium]